MARFLSALLDWPPRRARTAATRRRHRTIAHNKKGRRSMNERTAPNAHGVLIEPATLKIERLLPGPIERVWAYLTESDLRRKWLAAGPMEGKDGAPFEVVWRNDELTNPPGQRPPGMPDEHRMESRILEVDPPRKLAIAFGSSG